jgi:Ca2+-transporting ATPase
MDAISKFEGLDHAQAAALLAKHGRNDMKPPKTSAWLRRLGRVVGEPTLLALLGVLALYLVMGSLGEAVLLGAFVMLVLVITYSEESRTEHTLEALGTFASPRAIALRDGAWTRLAGLDIVPGDLLRLQEGDRVPADVEVLEAHDLRIDESLLSGESAAVWKRQGAAGGLSPVEGAAGGLSPVEGAAGGLSPVEGAAGGLSPVEARPVDSFAWAGSLVLGGQGLARVCATGLNTRVGQLSRSLADIEPDPTPFQRSARKLVLWLGWLGALSCGVVVLLGWRSGLGWAPALLQGLTLAVALVPEELPVVLSVFMAMGSRRLARYKVLVQRLPAVETLGAISVLAVDKTGTLTANRMRLANVLPALGVEEAALLAASARACEPEPFDPMEKEILARAGNPHGSLEKEYELQGLPPRMGHLWSDGILSVKGGLEGVLEHCLPDAAAAAWARTEASRLANQGMRVLGVAEGAVGGLSPVEGAVGGLSPVEGAAGGLSPVEGAAGGLSPVEGAAGELPGGLKLLGLLAFEDPLREGVPEALESCRKAGIRVVMVTGDAPETAGAIAKQAGFSRWDKVALGADLDEAASAACADAARVAAVAAEFDVFARLAPRHKQILIKAWSHAGAVVAMTGDGVNDAPALSQAHVGVAMGERGTDVAREAAGVVLVDDSFISLVEGVRLGRETTRNILRAAAFVLAVHVPIVGLVLLCLFLGLPPLVSAAQVAFLELFIGPACSVVFERAVNSQDVMAQPPRDPKAPFLPWKGILFSVGQGGIIFATVACLYILSLYEAKLPVPQARSLAFTTLMLGDLALCWTLLSPVPAWKLERWTNLWFWGVAFGVMGLLELLRSLSFTESVLSMPPLNANGWRLALELGLAATLWHEIPKLWLKAPTAA